MSGYVAWHLLIVLQKEIRVRIVFENGRVRVCVHPRFMPMIMPTHSSYTPPNTSIWHTHTHSFQTEGRQIEKLPWWFSRVSSGMYMFLLSLTIYVVQLYPKVNEEKVVKKGGCRKKTTQAKEMKEKRGKEKWKTQSVRYSFSCGLVNITWSPLWS